MDAINPYLRDCGYELRPVNQVGDKLEYTIAELTGVKGGIHNIVFAAIEKPDVLLTDVLNYTVQMPVDENKYLLYDDIIGTNGLTWGNLLEWCDNNRLPFDTEVLGKLWVVVRHCGSPIEEQFFDSYIEFVAEYGDNIPALLPQVYLFYDSKVQKECTIKIFDHQCMDFLMLFSGSQRVVIELDGVQHYSDGTVTIPGNQYPIPVASTDKYANMVSVQREMILAG